MNTQDGTLHNLSSVPETELKQAKWLRVGDMVTINDGVYRVQRLLNRGRVMLKWVEEKRT